MPGVGHRAFVVGLLLSMAAVTPAARAQTLTISPATATVTVGGDRRLTALVNGFPTAAVTWSVNGVPGGNAAVGTIDSAGKYTAPAAPPDGWMVTVQATSMRNPSVVARCVITVRNQVPVPTSLSPSVLAVGAFMLQVDGSRFMAGAEVRWNGVPLSTAVVSSTHLTATGVATQAGRVAITVANPGPAAVSQPLLLSIEPARTPTRTVAPTVTATRRIEPTRSFTPAATATRTAMVPSPTLRLEPTRTATTALERTATPPPTSTARIEPTRTATVVERTATMLPTNTARVEPSRTATATMVPTNTMRLEPSATPTMMVSDRTATMVPTNTARLEPSRTPTTTTMDRTATATGSVALDTTATMTPTAMPRTETGRTGTPSLVARTPTATRTVVAKIAVSVAPASVVVQIGATQQFQATVTGNANQGVTWTVNAIAGGDATVGTISASGLYMAPAVAPTTGAVAVAAVSVVDGTSQGTAAVVVQDPLAVTYGRFLDQATFGPTQALTAHLAQVGIPAFIDEQFAMPESPWPPLSTAQRSDAVDAFFANALSGQDQLRQRVVFALSEIIVEAMNKNTNGDEIVPWLQLLSRNAFGNYRTLLKEITLDGSMGKYLDLANSGLSGGAPNENFPREVMQLFSIGLYQLNLDGSVQLDANNQPIPTYTQKDVQQLAKALTGWTWGNPSGVPPAYGNFNYYAGPMLPVAAYHNTAAKTVLGQTLPANQSAPADLDSAIDIIFQHPNVGPFLATRLIRALVTSNPSPAYITRVATVFNGTGVRGDMQAVIRAILLDPEARNDAPPANFGRLRTPMQHTIALARVLGLDPGPASQFAYLFYDMNEGLLDAASVFGHYSPSYHIPTSPLFGPEFQIYSASDAINRANLFYAFMYSPWPINPALQPFVALAGNTAVLVNAVDHALLYGRMLPATRTSLLTAMPMMPDDNARVLTAVYLTSMSGEYLVQR